MDICPVCSYPAAHVTSCRGYIDERWIPAVKEAVRRAHAEEPEPAAR